MGPKLKSHKFWMAVAGGLFITLTEGLGVEIDQQTYWSLVGVLIAYIFGEAYIDAQK